jgi:hypothetical protein
MEGLAMYQIYLLTPDGEVLRTLELDCASDEDAVQRAIRLRGADEVEIEVWEFTRFIYWLPVPPVTWQKGAELIALIAASAIIAAVCTTLIKWTLKTLS